MKTGSLTIVGCGIKFMSHLTIEAKAFIEKSDCLLYLVNEPAMQQWLHQTNINAQSLENAYTQHSSREKTYQAITDTILQILYLNKHVCVVLEGHPSVFAKPGLDAALQARKQGYAVAILPGISSEAYLFAELGIDPGTVGCQSYEATDFLIRQRTFDGFSHLILWQISVIGMLNNNPEHNHAKNSQILVEHLNTLYSLEHEVFLFEGSQYPHIASTIKKIPLKNLPNTSISRITTMYLPPIRKAKLNLSVIEKLGISLS